MTETAHTALGAAVFLAGVIVVVICARRFREHAWLVVYAQYLVQQARLDVQHGAEPMRVARGIWAAEKQAGMQRKRRAF